MTHFLYGFIVVTLLFQLFGQFPSRGLPLKTAVANLTTMFRLSLAA